MQCFALALGFPEDYFREPMNPTTSDSLNQLRFLHYFPTERTSADTPTNSFGAGTHTDFGCLTLLFQQEGGNGLEICPGRESHTSGALGDTFFPIAAKTGPIVVNIGDMLSRTPRFLFSFFLFFFFLFFFFFLLSFFFCFF